MCRTSHKLLAFILALALCACSKVTIRPDPRIPIPEEPTHEVSKNYYLWGLVGRHRINVRALCQPQRVIQMQSRFSAVDVILAGITFGIYTPKTALIWCQEPPK